MRKNVKTEHWTPMEIRGVIGYFNDLRIDRKVKKIYKRKGAYDYGREK